MNSIVRSVEEVRNEQNVDKTLSHLKTVGQRRWERDDALWLELVLSLATLGKSESAQLVVDDQENVVEERYERLSFDTIAQMSPETRVDELRELLLDAGVRFPNKKSEALVENFELVKTKYGDPKGLKTRFAEHKGPEEKIDFLKQFEQIGPKYARNIGMDLYLPDFRDYIAIDSRIEGIFEEAGYDYEERTYEEQEAFLRSIADELDLEAWELDRILYNYESEVTTKLSLRG